MPAAALVAYLPAVAVSYAFTDDYPTLAATHGLGGGSIWKTAASGGRLISGALAQILFSSVTIDSLRFVRLVGLIGAALLGLLLQSVLSRKGINQWIAAAIAITIVMLPSFQVYVGWAGLFHAPYAALLAGLAWLVLASSFALSGRAGFLRRAEAGGLFLCGFLMYQPAAMFFWVFAAIDLLSPGERLARAMRKLGEGLGVAIAAMGVAYVVMRFAAHFHGAVTNNRAQLTREGVGKLQWFWEQPLRNALNLFALVPHWPTAAATATLATIGILLLHAQRGRQALGFLALAIVLVPLAYLPNLVVAEDWPSYRSVGALSALLMLYVWFGLWGVARAALAGRTPSGGRVLAAVAVTALAVIAVVLAARNVTTLFAKSQSVEVRMLRSTLRADRPAHVRRILFIKSGLDGPAPLRRYDEFGYPSNYSPSVPVPAVQLILRERHRTAPTIDVLAPDQVGARPPHAPGTLVVDMRKLPDHHLKWSFWTLRAGD